MRAFKYTTRYPAYTHTSFNLEWGRFGTYGGNLSMHFKYSWNDGGWWIGGRPEFDFHKDTDHARALRKKFKHALYEEVCNGCGKKAWHPVETKGWTRLGRLSSICPDCAETKPVKEVYFG